LCLICHFFQVARTQRGAWILPVGHTHKGVDAAHCHNFQSSPKDSSTEDLDEDDDDNNGDDDDDDEGNVMAALDVSKGPQPNFDEMPYLPDLAESDSDAEESDMEDQDRNVPARGRDGSFLCDESLEMLMEESVYTRKSMPGGLEDGDVSVSL
jgi:hypothetical protein